MPHFSLLQFTESSYSDFEMELIIGLIFLAALALSFCFYRHSKPQNFPPGPFWFPIVGNLPQVHILDAKLGYFHLVWEKLAKEYGPLVGMKLGRDLVVLCSGYEAVKCVYAKAELDGRQDAYLFRMRTYGERLGIAFTDGEFWIKTRNFVMKIFRDLVGTGKEEVEEIISKGATDLAELLEENCKNGEYRHKDLRTLFRLSALNTQWAIISGQRFELSDQKLIDFQKLVAGFFKSNDSSGGLISQIPWIRFIAPELSGYNTLVAIMRPLQKFCEDLVDVHAQKIHLYRPNRQRSLIDEYLTQIMQVNYPDPVFNRRQLICVLMDMFMAGPEMVSTFMAHVLQFLVLYPSIQEKIREEIDAVIGRASKASVSDMKKMPFTNAFIAESHRFSCMMPISVPHRAMADVKLFSYTIPKGTILLLSNYSVHMDKNHWGDPEVFRPERFLDKTGQESIQDNWVIPYGLGRRRCVGEIIAKDTIFIFLVTILQRFVISIPEGEVIDTKPMEGLTMSPKEFSGIIKLRD